jgi:hypothetical protein
MIPWLLRAHLWQCKRAPDGPPPAVLRMPVELGNGKHR